MKEFIKKLIISILAVLFMATFGYFFPQPKLYHYISSLFLLLLFYYIAMPLFVMCKKNIGKEFKKIVPAIGILSGNVDSPIREFKCQRAHTKITASIWLFELRKALEKIKFKKIRMLPTSEINNSFSIILNPFGDIFPEEDLKLHTTFYKICEYIKSGGIFVCTGGAFWSHQNPKISTIAEWAVIKTQNGKQSLKDSLLCFEFDIQPTGDEFDKDGKLIFQEPYEIEVYQTDRDKSYVGELIKEPTRIKRFRATTPSSSDFIPLLREKNDKSFPIVARRYGEGYLLHAGMFLESVESKEFKFLTQIIKYIVTKKFKNFS